MARAANAESLLVSSVICMTDTEVSRAEWPAERRQNLIFVLSIFGFPIASALPILAGVSSRYATVPFRAIVLLLSLSVLPSTLKRWRNNSVPLGQILILVVLGLEGLRIAWDFSVTSLPLDLPWNDYFLLFFGASFFPVLAIQQPVLATDARVAAATSEAAGIVAMILVMFAVGIELSRGIAGAARLSTEVLNPISLGHLAVSVVIVCSFCLIADSRRRGVGRALLVILRTLVIFVSLLVLVATGSRGPMVALLAAGLCAGVFLAVRSLRQFVLVMAVATVAAVAGAAVLKVDIAGVDRLLSFGFDQSGLERTQLLRGALSQYEEHPLSGSAVVEYFFRIYPHNIVVDAMMSQGIFGAAVLVCLLAITLGRAIGLLRHSAIENGWVVLLFIQYFVDSMFSGSLAFSPQFWVCLAMVWVLPLVRPTTVTMQKSPVLS
jgi:O-antigen ligase